MSTLTAGALGTKRIYARSNTDLGSWSPQGDRVFLDIETASDGPRGGLEKYADVTLLTVYDGHTVLMADTRVVDARIITDLLLDMNVRVIGHNLKFDLGKLARYDFRPERVYDTMLAEQLLNLGKDESARLDLLVKRYLRRDMDKTLQTSFGSTGPFSQEQLDYAADDVLALEPIYMAQRTRLANEGLVDAAKLEFALLPVLVDMESRGMLINVPDAEAMLAELEAKAEEAEAKVSELLTPIILRWRQSNLNIRDSERGYFSREVNLHQAQLEETITIDGFETRGERRKEITRLMAEFRKTIMPSGKLPAPYRMDTGPINMASRDQMLLALNELLVPLGLHLDSAQKEAVSATLDLVEDASVANILETYTAWKGWAKLITTTIRPLLALRDEHNRVSTTFVQIVRTGRMASREPNLQNVPIRTELGKRIRRLFVALAGRRITSADYSQIELRVLAEDIFKKTGGRNLLDIFLKGDLDVHSAVAALVFDHPYEEIEPEDGRYHSIRYEAKTINFMLLYGGTEYGLARELKLSKPQAKAKMDRYFAKLPDIAAWASYVEEEARNKGYAETMIGRKRYLPRPDKKLEYSEERKWQGHMRRVARNMPIQGTAADIMKIALMKIYEGLGLAHLEDTYILNVVHDEAVLEHPETDSDLVAETVNMAMLEAAEEVLKFCPVAVDISTGETWS